MHSLQEGLANKRSKVDFVLNKYQILYVNMVHDLVQDSHNDKELKKDLDYVKKTVCRDGTSLSDAIFYLVNRPEKERINLI